MTTPSDNQFEAATTELINVLFESLPMNADHTEFWNGHAVAAISSAAATASTSPAKMWMHASRTLQTVHVDNATFGRAQRAITVIDRDYPAWVRYIDRNLADIVGRAERDHIARR